METVYFYCVMTSYADKTDYRSGTAAIQDHDLAKLPNDLLDDICKKYGISREHSILIALNRL